MDYIIHLAILICLYLILAQSLNLTFGLGRLLNLAHISIFAIGAYTTALLSTGQSLLDPFLEPGSRLAELSYGFFFCVVASMLMGALFSLLIGAISIKLSEEYFAVGTLAFSSVVTALLINWKGVTRGVLGIPGIPRPVIFGVEYRENLQFLILIAVFCGASLAAMHLICRGRLARKLRALAESVPAAESLALNTQAVRNDAFIVSSMFAALAGSFFAYYINYIDPSSFGLNEMVFVLSIVVIGRPGSFWGVNLATAFLVLLPEPLRFIEIPPSILGPMRQMIYAMILFGVVYWKRATLFPAERRV